MACSTTLRCSEMGQVLSIELSQQAPSFSAFDASTIDTVYENGEYEIAFSCDDYLNEDIQTINVFLNDTRINTIEKDSSEKHVKGKCTRPERGNYEGEFSRFQPFLMQCDFVILSFELVLSDETHVNYYSNYLLCVSKDEGDRANIQTMMEDLSKFDNPIVEEWLFSKAQAKPNALQQGSWMHHAYKSYSTYLQLLENVIVCYRSNFNLFSALGKHSINKESDLLPYNKVRSVSVNGFQWLMQNAEQLMEVSKKTGISHNGKYYLPNRIKSEIGRKTWNTYENQVVLSFLAYVLANATLVRNELIKQQNEVEKILKRINNNVPKGYVAPIITIKTIQMSAIKRTSELLLRQLNSLRNMLRQYSLLFNIVPEKMISFPRKSKAFQEIRPYVQVFEMIVRWFRYGEFDFAKENLLLQVKTLDTLFEYYCLMKLLDMLNKNQYESEVPGYNHPYESPSNIFPYEVKVANTFCLHKEDVELVLYYQPIIRSDEESENGLDLYRSTRSYWTPDFVLKFKKGDTTEYVILDSKFAKRDYIRKKLLPTVIQHYGFEIAVAQNTVPLSSKMPKMVWVMQGRIDNEKPIDLSPRSFMARKYNCNYPFTGVVSINSVIDARRDFWREMKRVIPWI